MRTKWICALATLFCIGLVSTAVHADSGVLYGVRANAGTLTFRMLDLSSTQGPADKGSLTDTSSERLAGIFQNPDRGVGVMRTSRLDATVRKSGVRMAGVPGLVVDASSWDIGGLASSYAISSIFVPAAGAPIALVSHYSDTPPFWLTNVDLATGAVTLLPVRLEKPVRYSHLTQCPDASIYAIAVAPQDEVRLVRMDLSTGLVTRMGRLQLNGNPLRGNVHDLACGPTGGFYVLSDVQHAGSNALYALDAATGALTWIRDFDVDRVTFVR
jgi:hypothetical protein